MNQVRRIVPTIIFPDDSILVEPPNAELAEKLGLATRAERTYYDVRHWRWAGGADHGASHFSSRGGPMSSLEV